MIFIKTKAFVAFFAYVCITYYACFAGHLKLGDKKEIIKTTKPKRKNERRKIV